jgi:hypothetical protein
MIRPFVVTRAAKASACANVNFPWAGSTASHFIAFAAVSLPKSLVFFRALRYAGSDVGSVVAVPK